MLLSTQRNSTGQFVIELEHNGKQGRVAALLSTINDMGRMALARKLSEQVGGDEELLLRVYRMIRDHQYAYHEKPTSVCRL